MTECKVTSTFRLKTKAKYMYIEKPETGVEEGSKIHDVKEYLFKESIDPECFLGKHCTT